MSEGKAIVAKNLVKKFSRHSDKHLSYGLKDLFSQVFLNRSRINLRNDEFYAVKNISLAIGRGECLGLIGRNGCGKTTLLKMICGLIQPESGTIKTCGNIQALIALGAGFDKRLNGLENIKTAAAINGISGRRKKELIEKVIDFSELEEFIESPVSTYSSGMYARLGFSVAAFLDPDILLIDEILGVGDFAFQNKCFSKIQDIRNSGTTILLVSHSHAKIVQLCDRAIWIDRGNALMDGPADEVVKKYISSLELEQLLKESKKKQQQTNQIIQNRDRIEESPYGPLFGDPDLVDDLIFELKSSRESGEIRCHDELTIEYQFRLVKSVSNLNVSLNILTQDGVLLTTLSTLNGDLLQNRHSGKIHCRVTIFDLNLNPGSYVVVMPIHDGQAYLSRNMVSNFRVLPNENLTWGKIDFNHNYDVL